jgi:hypothetical protein
MRKLFLKYKPVLRNQSLISLSFPELGENKLKFELLLRFVNFYMLNVVIF